MYNGFLISIVKNYFFQKNFFDLLRNFMKQYFRLIFSFKNILKNQVFKIFNKFILDLLQMSIKNKLFLNLISLKILMFCERLYLRL